MKQTLSLVTLLVDDYDTAIAHYTGALGFELLEDTDYPKFDVEGTNQTFMEWEHHKAENIMGFRDNAYKSLMTGTMAPKHHTPWLEAMDDTLEVYLKN